MHGQWHHFVPKSVTLTSLSRSPSFLLNADLSLSLPPSLPRSEMQTVCLSRGRWAIASLHRPSPARRVRWRFLRKSTWKFGRIISNRNHWMRKWVKWRGRLISAPSAIAHLQTNTETALCLSSPIKCCDGKSVSSFVPRSTHVCSCSETPSSIIIHVCSEKSHKLAWRLWKADILRALGTFVTCLASSDDGKEGNRMQAWS